MTTKSTGLVKCPGWPKNYPCDALVQAGRRCRSCESVRRKHPDDGYAARQAQESLDGLVPWWLK